MQIELTAEAITASNTGFRVPESVIAELGGGKRPKVVVTVGDATLRTSIAPMGGCFLIGLSKANNALTGVEAGRTYTLDLTLDTAERTVEVPAELAEAFAAEPALQRTWEAWSYTKRREAAEAIEGAKRPETRARRVEATLTGLRA